MEDDRNNGSDGGANGGGGGGGGDAIDDFAEADDETVVIVTDGYTRASLGRLGERLRGAADRCDRLGALGSSAADEATADLILEDLERDMEEAEVLSAGTRRGVTRLRGARRAERLRREEAAARAARRGR